MLQVHVWPAQKTTTSPGPCVLAALRASECGLPVRVCARAHMRATGARVGVRVRARACAGACAVESVSALPWVCSVLLRV
eukprot:4644493-Alexandrium_andersonii.AAC.1